MRMIEDAEKYKAEDEKYQKKVEAVNALDDFVYKIRHAIDDVDNRNKLRLRDQVKINMAIAETKKLLDASKQTETEVFVDHLKAVKSLIEPIMKIN